MDEWSKNHPLRCLECAVSGKYYEGYPAKYVWNILVVASNLMMLAKLWTDTDHDEALGANPVALAELVNIEDRIKRH
jgi:hypothetical protein